MGTTPLPERPDKAAADEMVHLVAQTHVGDTAFHLPEPTDPPVTSRSHRRESVPEVYLVPPTRLFATTYNVPAGGFPTPVRLFPADANRESLTITITNAARVQEAVGIYLGESLTDASTPGTSFVLALAPGSPFTISGYTGAVYVNTSQLANATTLSAMTVSRAVTDDD